MLFTNTCAIATVRDRSGRMLSAGTALASLPWQRVCRRCSTLFAKNGFSWPSLEEFCGVFGHVLFPQESPPFTHPDRSEEHTSELQSRGHLVCRLLLDKIIHDTFCRFIY